MKFASSGMMTAALVLASTVLSMPSFGTAQAQEAIAAVACRAIDYAFADQERDYYAFYAFDRNYSATADQPACGAATPRQTLAARQ